MSQENQQLPEGAKAPDWQPAPIPKNPTQSQEAVSEEEIVDVGKKIYNRSVKGQFASWRVRMVLLTQILFYGLAWLNWNGRQAVLFDLTTRKFYIFGLVLWPQDIFYLALILIVSAYGLFLFTALAGRLFCGYACPQTVYTEIFMWIERKIEGDRVQRMRLDEAPLSFKKFRIKAFKHIVWILVAFWTGVTFVGYFTPIRDVVVNLFAHGNIGGWAAFWIFLYGIMCWCDGAILRESVCRYMCPYARFQSVMIDSDTFVVTYDKLRGDPRGKRSKKVNPRDVGMGDCVDCTICVQVCPTGIDIRDGLQYMCIGCGACIDACNDVMKKMNYPKGLIRYTSENAMLQGLTQKQARKHLLRPRVFVYVGLLCVFICGIVISLSLRNDIRFSVVRDRASLGREIPGGMYENVYRVLVVNMTEEPRTFQIDATASELKDPKVLMDDGGNTIKVTPFSNTWVPIMVHAPTEGNKPGRYDLELKVHSIDKEPELEADQDSSFFVPN